jgi:SAM-dependent methyltransferase
MVANAFRVAAARQSLTERRACGYHSNMRLIRHPLALALLLVTAAAGTAAAQIASRPAADWVKVLDNPERLAAMKIDEVVAALRLQPGNVIADLGAGSGPFIVPFAKAVTASGKVYAVEIDRGFFPYIEEKASKAGAANVRTVLGAFTDPQLPSADVDVAFMHDVLHHIEQREAYLRTLVKYLKPSARIAIIDYNPADSPHGGEPAMQTSKEHATAWLAAVGFKPIEEVALFGDKWFVIYGR